MESPAPSIAAGVLELRRYDISDAAALHDAITKSVEHLRPWMPWIAGEPLTLHERERLITDVFEAGWNDGSDYVYGIFNAGTLVGGCGLHRRIGGRGLEVGYWVAAAHTRRGFATGAARALTEAAFGLSEIDHVEIHHDKANVHSGAIPAKLGYTFVREVTDEISAPGEVGISCEWRLDRDGAAARP